MGASAAAVYKFTATGIVDDWEKLREKAESELTDSRMAKGYDMAAFTGLGKVFTKSGVKITTDLSDCQPDGITIPEIDFCSFQDVVKVTREGLLTVISASGTANSQLVPGLSLLLVARVMGGCHRPAPISIGATTRGLLKAKLWFQWWSEGLRL